VCVEHVATVDGRSYHDCRPVFWSTNEVHFSASIDETGHAVQIVCGAHIMQDRPAGMVLDVACRLSCQLLEKIQISITEIYPADVAEPKKLRQRDRERDGDPDPDLG
jgi:hypothetical protein